MFRDRVRRMIAAVAVVAVVAASAVAQESETAAQTEQTETADTTAPAAATATAAPGAPAAYGDSNETREVLRGVLAKYPPQVSRVLKIDPALFTNATYLANYPELAAFVAAHPEVTHSPAFFMEGVWIPTDMVPESASERMWRDMTQGIAIFVTMALVAGVMIWLIRTLIDHRRWSRLTRTQAEVHGKLMDRFTSNEELLAYMQTPGGKRFLESAPIAIDAGPRAAGAPVSRILWSMQAGVILATAGIGLLFISGSVDKAVSEPLLAMGILTLSIGGGFLLSAVVSYVLSKRLGLIGQSGTAAAPSQAD
jgi:hypothetical protein